MSVLKIIKKITLILSKHQKTRIVELVVLMIIGGALETLSVSLMLPFMNIVMNPDVIMEKPYIRRICNLLSLDNSRSFLVILALLLAMLFFIKNLYLVFEYNIQYKFIYGNMFKMQEKLLDTIIHRPYEYFLNASSGAVIRLINLDTVHCFRLLTTLLSLFTEMVISGMLIIAVFVMSPVITIVMAAVLMLFVLFINRVIKPVLGKAGIETQKSATEMNKWLLQSVQGIKTSKVYREEQFFEENFNKNGQKYVMALKTYDTISVVPRFLIEASCMGVVFIIVSILIYTGSEIETMIPILSAVAVAAMRLLPSVNRISQALTSITYGEPMLDKLIENIQSFEENAEYVQKRIMDSAEDLHDESWRPIPRLSNAIEVVDLSYVYPGGEGYVLKDVSLRIFFGQSVGIVGTTGSGKTTLVDLLLGLLVPQKGGVFVDDYNIKDDMAGWLRQVGYISQDIFLLDDTIRANVVFGEEDSCDDMIWKSLSEASLEEFVRGMSDGLDTEIGECGVRLSGGQRQRIGIARALYRSPDILIFDEATSALDNETEAAIMESINGLHGKKTMIIIAHRLSTIESCDHVYRVENGKIIKER